MHPPVFPIFTLKTNDKFVFAGGGGGDPLYGKKNGIVVYDLSTYNGICWCECEDVIDRIEVWENGSVFVAACGLTYFYIVEMAKINTNGLGNTINGIGNTSGLNTKNGLKTKNGYQMKIVVKIKLRVLCLFFDGAVVGNSGCGVFGYESVNDMISQIGCAGSNTELEKNIEFNSNEIKEKNNCNEIDIKEIKEKNNKGEEKNNFKEEKNNDIKANNENNKNKANNSKDEYIYPLIYKNNQINIKNNQLNIKNNQLNIKNTTQNWHSFFIKEKNIHLVTHQNETYKFTFKNKTYEFKTEPSEIKFIPQTQELVFYLRRDDSLLYFLNPERIFKIKRITALSVDGETVAVGNSDGEVFIFDKKRKFRKMKICDLPVTSCAVRGNFVYYASFNGLIDRRKIGGNMMYFIFLFFLIGLLAILLV